MLGGPIRDRMQVYWSHCGTYRARYADRIKEWAGVEPVRTLDDVVALGARGAGDKGFKGLKTNLIRFEPGRHYMYGPGTGGQPGFPELNADTDIADAAVDQLAAFREGAGTGVGLHLDTNFNYKIDGYIRLARALEPLDLVWLEIDLYDPAGPGAHPQLGAHADRLARVDLRPAPVPPVFRAPIGRLRDHRRGVERHPRIGEDRHDGRRLRGQLSRRTISTAISAR